MNVRDTTYSLIEAMAPQPPSLLTDDLCLGADLGYDSIRLIELTIALERQLALPTIDLDRAATAATVGAVVELVTELRQG